MSIVSRDVLNNWHIIFLARSASNVENQTRFCRIEAAVFSKSGHLLPLVSFLTRDNILLWYYSGLDRITVFVMYLRNSRVCVETQASRSHVYEIN